MEIKNSTEEDLWNDMNSEIKEIVNFGLLTDEHGRFHA